MFSRLFRRTPPPPPAAVPADMRVYAVGDIHGRDDLLARLLDRIQADAYGFTGALKLVFLGDYVDRGVASREVLARLIGLDLPGFGFTFLKGNHEAAMLDFLKAPDIGPDWVAFGGGATLLSYGVRAELVQRARFAEAREELLHNLPTDHVQFLRTLSGWLRIGDYAFVHAGIRPGLPVDRQAEQDLLWIREEFLDSRLDHGAVIVHGHTVTDEPQVRPNRIGIDTGAYATGRLTSLVLEGTTRRFLHT